MKKLAAVASACLLATALWAGPAPAEGPSITVEPQSFDFGQALQHRTLSKEFTIRNFGSADLVIQRVTTTCGCTTAPLEEKHKTIKPGGSSPLTVKLETRTYTGPLNRSVLIKSNDPEKGFFEIKVKATVVPEDSAK